MQNNAANKVSNTVKRQSNEMKFLKICKSSVNCALKIQLTVYNGMKLIWLDTMYRPQEQETHDAIKMEIIQIL